MGAVWLTGKVKVEVTLDYSLCNGLLYAGQESVTYTVPVTSYIPIQIGREEKHLISFICCYLSILPHPRYSWIFFALIKTEEQ